MCWFLKNFLHHFQYVLDSWESIMFRIIIVTVICFPLVFGGFHVLRTCESSIGHVVNASVTGSKLEQGKYILKRGTNAGIDVNFNTKKQVNDVRAFAVITLNGLELSSMLPNLNGCKVLKCPLQKGGPYFYSVSLPVKEFYLPIEVDAKLQLMNEKQDIIACIIIPAKIK